MKGFAQFQDDLRTLRRYVEWSNDPTRGAVDAKRALERVEAFAQTLENAKLGERP